MGKEKKGGKFEEGMGEGCGRESLRMGWGGEVGEFKRDWGEELSRIVYRVVGEWKEEGKFKEGIWEGRKRESLEWLKGEG